MDHVPSQNYGSNIRMTDAGTMDVLGDEFPSPFYEPKAAKASPLMADVPGADTSNWSSAPRPTITAWEGADLDAYWFNGEVWLHCQTGAGWSHDEAVCLAPKQSQNKAA